MDVSMLWTKQERRQFFCRSLATSLLVIAHLGTTLPVANAIITGSERKEPVTDPGWPRGAADIFNSHSRIAWWEGPPFGGGQYTAECPGDTTAFNEILAKFAKLKVTTKRLVIHDGIGNSFWLNPNHRPEKHPTAKIDWSFTVWVPAKWEQIRKLPTELNPTDTEDATHDPPVTIVVYTGGSIRWSDVTIPKEVKVIDRRKARSSPRD